MTELPQMRQRVSGAKLTLRRFVRDFLWALRYWQHFHREERLHGPLRHAWRYAAKVAPRNRRNDRRKYA